MSDLQLALIAAGAAAVGGVWAYNKWQESRHRRLAEQAFKGDQPDVLLKPAAGDDTVPLVPVVRPDERLEPVLDPPVGEPAAPEAATAPVTPDPAPAAAEAALPPLPGEWADEIADCVVRLDFVEPLAASALWAVQQPWAAHLARPLNWLGFDEAAHRWRPLDADDGGRYPVICGALQLADRRGVVSDSELSVFLDGARQLAEQFTGVAQVPSRDEVLMHARGLDDFCASDLDAPSDIPAHRTATADGFAMRSSDTIGAGDYNSLPLRLRPDAYRLVRGDAVPVQSGDRMPEAADAVLPLEFAEVNCGSVEVTQTLAPGDGVAEPGEECRAGEILLAAARCLRAQDLARLLELLGVEHAAAHHEAQRAARVHHVAADASAHVLVAGDGGQHFAGLVVRHVAGQHLAADLFQVVVDVLQRVGAVFGVGVEEHQQHVLGVFDQAGHAARAHAQQAKHRHVLVVDGEQHALALELGVVLVEDEGHADRARVLCVVDQEVRADVQFAVVFLEESGRFLDVLVHRVFGDGQAEMLFDPAPFLGRGTLQIDPDGLELGQVFERLDFFLEQAAIGEGKDIEHGCSRTWISDGECRV